MYGLRVKRVVFYVFNLLNQTLKGKNIQVKKANKKRMLHLVPLAAKDKWLLCKRLMSTLSKISVSCATYSLLKTVCYLQILG